MQELPVVSVSELTKTYKGGNFKALDAVSLEIPAGEIFGLIGPNGAGKTTLIGCLLGLLKPDSGSISICGKTPDFLSIRMMTGYVPERPEFEYWMTARQFLQYHHGLAKLNPASAEQDIDAALELLELPRSAWSRRLKTYSRGMLQRLNLAQMVIGNPRLMLLDEPTLGLDPKGVAVVRKLVNEMRGRGATAIINSHQLDEIEKLCDRVAFIRQGRIASIEHLRGGELCDYVVAINWTHNVFDGLLQDQIGAAAKTADASLCEHHSTWGRFLVKDKEGAARLVKELVSRGFPVAEVVPERARLEQLFLSAEDGDEAAVAAGESGRSRAAPDGGDVTCNDDKTGAGTSQK